MDAIRTMDARYATLSIAICAANSRNHCATMKAVNVNNPPHDEATNGGDSMKSNNAVRGAAEARILDGLVGPSGSEVK